jgi:hypothetical protein
MAIARAAPAQRGKTTRDLLRVRTVEVISRLLSDEVLCATANFIRRCLEARGRSGEEFVDLVSR